MNTWLWFRPFLYAAVIGVYAVLTVWAVFTGGPLPGIWFGQ